MQSTKRRILTISTAILLIGIAKALETPQQEVDHCIKVNNDPKKIICVCDKNFCDKFDFEWPQTPGQASLVESTQAGDRFKVSSLDLSATTSQSVGTVKVHLDAKRQKIIGWGGAITDAAAININRMAPNVSEKLLQSYYGADGLSYNFGRVPIAGSDFSTHPYSYDDTDEPDYNLTQWSLAPEDIKYKIPTIQRAAEIVNSRGETLKLFATPWSPPRWMKTNHGFKRGYLIDEDRIYRSYANYLIKFFDAYRAKGIEFWGATVQNEPLSSYMPFYYFNSLQLGNAQAIKLISEYLGPALEASGRTKENFKLMVGDDSLGFINMQVPQIMQLEKVQKYVSGLAFHWYTSGLVAPYNSLTRVVDAIKGHIEFVLMTEACLGSMPGLKHVDLGSWDRGESYASDIIEDLKREVGGWIDWNIALDESGGPNWAKNFVDSPIIVNKIGDKFYKQPMFYTLAHFTRFFRPGSIYTKVETADRSLNGLTFAAVQTEKSGHLIVNVLNKANRAMQFSLVVEDGGATKYRINSIQLQPKSLNSIVIKL